MLTRTTRRQFLAAAMASAAAWPARATSKQVAVRIGWNALAGAAPIVGAMQEQALFEKHAKPSGYEVQTEWQQFMAGPPANEAMVAGRLDLDMDLASAAYIARIKQGVPAVLIGTQASHLSNAIMVRPGSPIKTVADLQDKTVGVPVATSAQYTLASIVQGELGKTLDQAGIRLVNMSPADAVKMPAGIDAAAIWVPFQFIGPQLGLASLLVDANGLTGPAYEKSGIRLNGVKKTWGYPEGYFTDRLYITAHEKFATEHPDLVVAFLLARWEAQDWVAANFDKAVAIGNRWWKLPPDVAKLAAATYPENTNIRNAPLLLEWDALTFIKTSEYFASIGTIDHPLTWKELAPVMLKGAEFQKRVWEARGKMPTLEKLRKGFEGSAPGWPEIIVNGGEPIWRYGETPHWGERLYKPGPFESI
jgi:sulfonate transport system substrate-binding protein